MTSDRDLILYALVWSATAIGASLVAWEAQSHEWYPPQCCSDRDCAEIPATAIREGQGGVTVLGSGEVIPYSDRRIKDSPDGAVHICRPPGNPEARTICLFLPPKSF